MNQTEAAMDSRELTRRLREALGRWHETDVRDVDVELAAVRGVIDPILADAGFEQTRDIVAATLRLVATWEPMTADELTQAADDIARATPDRVFCPACAEVTCDKGCPFERTRH